MVGASTPHGLERGLHTIRGQEALPVVASYAAHGLDQVPGREGLTRMASERTCLPQPETSLAISATADGVLMVSDRAQ
jgi:hypothetical protein